MPRQKKIKPELKVNELLEIRNYILNIASGAFKHIEKTEISSLYNKIPELDKQIIDKIKELI